MFLHDLAYIQSRERPGVGLPQSAFHSPSFGPADGRRPFGVARMVGNEGDAVCVASVKEARRWAEEAGGICPEVRWVGRDGLPSDADVDLGVESVDGATSVDGRRGQKPFAR